MASSSFPRGRQQGVSLLGLIVFLAIAGMIAILAMKVVPTVTEYLAAKKAIQSIKAAGGSPQEMRAAFNRQAEVGYIESIKGSDLDIVRQGEQTELSFAYQKVIPLVGPVSLLIDYEASTAAGR